MDEYFEEDFHAEAEAARRLRGYHGEKQMSRWERLQAGKTVGKLATMLVQGAGVFNGIQFKNTLAPAPTNILNVQGADADAQDLCVTVMPPQFTATQAGMQVSDVQSAQDPIDWSTAASGFGGFTSAAAPDAQLPNLVARVEWGVGGVGRNIAEVDIANGCRINLTASYVRVYAFRDQFPAGASLFATIGAFIGPGTARVNDARRTYQIAGLDQNVESALLSIPRYARSVSLFGWNSNHDLFSGTIRFYRNAVTPMVVGNEVAEMFFSGNVANALQVPIPNGAYYFSVVSAIAGPAAGVQFNQIQAMFDLAI